jgi:T5SS/PEP-CTERM-associated repeat protein
MADTFQWTTPGTSGTFDVAADWTDTTNSANVAFPGSTDTANLIGTATQQTITGPANVSVLNVAGANLLTGSFTTGLTRIDSLTGTNVLALAGTLTASTGVTVGDEGTGGLTIDSGSTVTAGAGGTGSKQVVVGNATGASGTVTVLGTLDLAGPSGLTNYGALIGNSGAGLLTVSGAGATVVDQGSDGVGIGQSANSTGTLVINGGATAVFGTTNGESLSAVGVAREGAGAVTVDGAGSTLTANGGVYVGRAAAGVLVVSNHAVVTQTGADTYFEIGDGSSSSDAHIGGTGSGTVETNGTLATAGYLRIGGFGVNGALTVETGGMVSAAVYSSASTSASAIVVGTGGTISGNGDTQVGNGSLEIDAGSTVDATGAATPGVAGLSVASGTVGTSGTVSVNGAGAVLNTGANLIVVGSTGHGVMNVSGGGAITGTSPGTGYGAIVVGNSAGSVGLLTVSGTGSTATANGQLTVGYLGTGTVNIGAGGQITASSVAIGLSAGAIGVIGVAAGGSLTTTGALAVGSGGTGTLALGGGTATAASFNIGSGGNLTGNGTASGPVAGTGAVTATGGTLTLSQATTGVSLNIASDGDLVLGSSVASGEQVAFASGTSGRLDLLTPGSFAGTLGVVDAGDTIFAAGAASATLNSGILTLFDSSSAEIGTMQLAAGSAAGAVIDNGGTITIACFATGTRIATPVGAVAVEALRVGAAVTLATGGTAPVTWLGHRRVDCARHPRPWDVLPIRVRAHAFGPGQPHTDLLLSPDHAVFVDGHLIPVRYLLNGATIVQEQVEAITYWHVELPSHGVLLAEGLPAESFLDTGNRDAFAGAGRATQLHPDFARRVWAAEGCAPLLLGGPDLVAAKQALLARAVALGHALTENSGLLVTADGRELPVETDGRQWRAVLPEGAQTVRLISRTWNPAHTRAEESDTRKLGVALSHLWLNRRSVGLDSPGLTVGWHPAEAEWRWTDGAAEVPVAGLREIAFTLAMQGLYWRDSTGRHPAAVRAA